MAEVSATRSISSERIVAQVPEVLQGSKITPKSCIALFDSGVGGLSVLKEVMKQLPSENVIIIADTARLPYGGRSAAEIVKINNEIMNFIMPLGAKLVVIACGTSSAIAYPIIKEHYKVPMISLIEPGAQAAVRATGNGKIGVIATQATTDSGAYERSIKRIRKDAEVFSAACPLFVPLIEGGFIEADETRRTAAQYLKPLIKQGIDTLVLGCTHYPHLTKILREITGIKMKFIDPGEEAVAEAKKLLASKNLLAQKEHSLERNQYRYFVTGSVAQFQDMGARLLGKPVMNVKQVVLPKTGRRGR